MNQTDTSWTETSLGKLREFGKIDGDRTAVVTGADGFMGSHLTDAQVELDANVHAFGRATSSEALNTIGHLRNRRSRICRRPKAERREELETRSAAF